MNTPQIDSGGDARQRLILEVINPKTDRFHGIDAAISGLRRLETRLESATQKYAALFREMNRSPVPGRPTSAPGFSSPVSSASAAAVL